MAEWQPFFIFIAVFINIFLVNIQQAAPVVRVRHGSREVPPCVSLEEVNSLLAVFSCALWHSFPGLLQMFCTGLCNRQQQYANHYWDKIVLWHRRLLSECTNAKLLKTYKLCIPDFLLSWLRFSYKLIKNAVCFCVDVCGCMSGC